MSPLWSLRWEILFSLLLPIYVWLAKSKVRPAAVMLALIGCSFAGSVTSIDALRYLPIFGCGAVLAAAMRNGSLHMGSMAQRQGPIALTTAVLLLSARAMASPWSSHLIVTAISETFVIVGAIVLIVLAIAWDPLGRFLRRPVATRLGAISFSLYLIHEPVVLLVAASLSDTIWLAVPIAIAVSLIAGSLFYRLVERPAHKLARRIGAHAFVSDPTTRNPAGLQGHRRQPARAARFRRQEPEGDDESLP